VEIEPLSPGSDNNPPNSPSGGNNSSSENLIPANDTRKGMVADPEDPKIVVNAGNDRNGIAGAPVTFSGSARIGTNPAPESARFLWNFGDGKTFIGKNTTHVYRSPGRYLSTLTVSSGDTSTTDMATISIGNSPMEIGEVVVGPSGFITVTNQGQTAIDISSWYLEAGGKWFIFPQGTFIAAKGEVPFDALTTELLPLTPEAVSLRFPSGLEAARFGGVQRKDEGITASIEGKASPLEEGVSVTKANEGEVIPIASQMRVNADEMLSNAALVSEAEDEKRKGSLWWYGALVFVLALGTVGVVLVEKKKPVDEFEIIEGDE
jgi:PKD repeat protein